MISPQLTRPSTVPAALEGALRGKERDLATLQDQSEATFAEMNAELTRLGRELDQEKVCE